jgi:hypothetical protein
MFYGLRNKKTSSNINEVMGCIFKTISDIEFIEYLDEIKNFFN